MALPPVSPDLHFIPKQDYSVFSLLNFLGIFSHQSTAGLKNELPEIKMKTATKTDVVGLHLNVDECMVNVWQEQHSINITLEA